MEIHDFQFFTLETMVIQTIILFLILFVLNKFIFKPYLAYLDKETERRKKIEDDYNNIDKLNMEAGVHRDALMTDARKRADDVIKNSQIIAKNEASLIKQQAEQEAVGIKKSALAEVQKEKENMLNDVKSKSIDLILKFNARLFDKEAVNRDFVEKEIGSF